ncbi:glycoside hydrolase family 2 protein [Bacillus sp. 1P02SD]|uniref:glycoside hydrolase family 2 protein n=1 Tax=Bacillus sp. 1P02SD TaxID=3132264 RepID=UPI0039A34F85
MREKLNLNGVWGFQIDPKDHGEIESWHTSGLPDAIKVEVPHIWQREKEYVNYCGPAWYETEFNLDNIENEKKIFLCFEAVDFQARVWINDIYVGEHEGGFTPFEFDITESIKANKKNTLTLRVYDPQDNAEIPIGKQGSWYTRVSGIWQGVFLESRTDCHIKNVHMIPNIEDSSVVANISLAGDYQDSVTVSYTITNHLDRENVVTEVSGSILHGKASEKISLTNIVLWSPENPHLYDLIVKVFDSTDGRLLDEYQTYFGMRKIEYSNGQLLLNNQPLFVRGALDQAYYPQTIYTAPSDEWIQNEIRLAMEMGFNLLRKHIKVEIPQYLYWADRMGMLIWAEPPNYVKWSEQSRNRFYNELVAMIKRDFNHPSIIIWSLYNEEWGLEWDLANDTEKQEYVVNMFDDIKLLDPTRLICDNSGWTHVKTDINDHHRYFVTPEQDKDWKKDIDDYLIGNPTKNFVKGYESNGEPIIVSEFGVWGLPSVQQLIDYYQGKPSWFENLGDDTHKKDFKRPLNAFEKFDKYKLDRIFGDFENLSHYSQRRMYRSVKNLIEEMRKRQEINGYVITEFTDVEWETNGWLTYTRDMKEGFEHAGDFNGSLVVMLDGIERNLWCGSEQSWDIILSNHDLKELKGVLRWEITNTDLSGLIEIDEGRKSFVKLPNVVHFTTPHLDRSEAVTIKVNLQIDNIVVAKNDEELTISPVDKAPEQAVFPYKMAEGFVSRLGSNGMKIADCFENAEVVITSFLDKDVLEYYRLGGRVLFLAEDGDRLLEKGQFTFRQLAQGESWDRTSSFNYVDKAYFDSIPLNYEMGWEFENLFPEYIIPFSNYNKLGGTMGRVVYMFGNENITETSQIVSGYFQGWIGQAGGSLLVQRNAKGILTTTTWKLIDNYGSHPIATQVINYLLKKLMD